MNTDSTEISLFQLTERLATRQDQLRQAQQQLEAVLDADDTDPQTTAARMAFLNSRIASLHQTIISLLEQDMRNLSVNVTFARTTTDDDVTHNLQEQSTSTAANQQTLELPADLPTFKRNLPTDIKSIDDFMDQLQNDLESALIDPVHWPGILIAKVKLAFADWIKENTPKETFWPDLKIEFLKKIKSTSYKKIERSAFEKIVMQTDKAMGEFTARYGRTLSLSSRREDANVRYHFLSKIPQWVQDKIDNKNLSAESSTLDELMTVAVSAYEESKTSYPQSKIHPKSQSRTGPSPSSNSHKNDTECTYCASKGFPGRKHHVSKCRTKITVEKTNTTSSSSACFVCGSPDHMANKCPSKKVTFQAVQRVLIFKEAKTSIKRFDRVIDETLAIFFGAPLSNAQRDQVALPIGDEFLGFRIPKHRQYPLVLLLLRLPKYPIFRKLAQLW
jgi:hypothetical protein